MDKPMYSEDFINIVLEGTWHSSFSFLSELINNNDPRTGISFVKYDRYPSKHFRKIFDYWFRTDLIRPIRKRGIRWAISITNSIMNGEKEIEWDDKYKYFMFNPLLLEPVVNEEYWLKVFFELLPTPKREAELYKFAEVLKLLIQKNQGVNNKWLVNTWFGITQVMKEDIERGNIQTHQYYIDRYC